MMTRLMGSPSSETTFPPRAAYRPPKDEKVDSTAALYGRMPSASVSSNSDM